MNILVVDDHALVREGLRHALQSLAPDVMVLEAGDAEEALRAVEQHAELDLVLLDLGLPGTDGYATLTRIHERNGALPVIILSASDSGSDVLAALGMGAAGFIPKTFARDLTLQAVRLVLAGSVYIPPQALRMQAPQSHLPAQSYCGVPSQHTTPACALRLTERQADVLRLLARGKPNKLIASELAIAESTVKAHITEILRALKVTNRAQALIAASRLGMN